MKEEFSAYLESIGIAKPLQERIEQIYEFYSEFCPEEITRLFVTDYIKDDGSREYENLWFFTPSFCMEAKQFILKNSFDMDAISKRILNWEVQSRDYDFHQAGENSRLSLIFHLSDRRACQFKASKENCDYLKVLLQECVIPNMRD